MPTVGSYLNASVTKMLVAHRTGEFTHGCYCSVSGAFSDLFDLLIFSEILIYRIFSFFLYINIPNFI